MLTTPGGAQAGGARQVAQLNHVYGVLDVETATAIETSGYLRQFANFEVRTTTGGGQTWTGRYLMGRETYVELFAAGSLPGQDAAEGSAGLAISPDRQGGNATVIERLRRGGIEPTQYEQTKDFGDGVPVPWFGAVFTSPEYDAFSPWAMEYKPSYFADPRSKTEPATFPGDVSRERYLSDNYQDHLMRDVTGLRLGVTTRDLDSTLPLLRAGGFEVRTIPTGAIAKDGSTTIQLDRVARPEAGLKEIRFRLNRRAAARTEQIGHSTLVVGPGPQATWTFS
jgi:hypothetical protein